MRVVLDTNVFVAAGFNPRSSSARIVDAVRGGDLTHVWDATTRDEIRYTLKKIPPLNWSRFEDLFEEGEYTGETDPGAFTSVPDPADRPFAALARAAKATLVTNDHHLFAARGMVNVGSPGVFARTHLE